MFGGSLEKADQAYPKLVNEVLPASMLGFFVAVMFGAILSSFNSVLNSAVTLFGVDIYSQYIKKGASDLEMVKQGKRFGIVLALVSMIIAPFLFYASEGLFGYLQEVNGCYSIPILTIIVVGYLTKRVPAIAAKVGLFSGVVLYTISQFVLKPMMASNAVEQAKASGITDVAQLDAISAAAYPHFLHVMAILFVFNVIIMLIIGRLYPRDTDFVLPYTKQVDITPYKYVRQVGIAVCIIVVAIYVYFA
jgi:SSS family solute:Na+ symporter